MMAFANLNRRDFEKLALAALGGVLAGASLAEAADAKKEDKAKPKDPRKNYSCKSRTSAGA